VALARRRSHQRRVPILLTLLRLGLLKTTGALTNSAAPTYDAAGNTLTINGAVYAYDQKNQLKSISGLDSNGAMVTVNHQYDSMGRRISSTVNNQSILYVYDGWNVVEEYSSSNLQSFDLKTILTWGIDLSGSAQGAGGVGGLLFTEDITSNTTWHHHYDGNGNVTHLTNASGQTVATYTYDAFGNTVTATGVAATANRYRFSTKPIDEHIATTPLYYYGYRYYHPQTGRWINRDPIEEEGGLNLYGFVGNNGVDEFDIVGRRGFWDWVQDIFDNADQTETALVRDTCMAFGSAMLLEECIKARKALLKCINDPECDLDAAERYKDKVCKLAEKGCNAACPD